MLKERILIIEDNRALSKILTKKMEKNLDFDIIQAYSYAQAEEIIEENDDFFIVLCDLNLPDAPNGEIVDFVLYHDLPIIVLTGSEDDDIRNMISEKNIVDYVYKGGIKDVNYIFSLIDKLSKNRDIKVMFVDNSIRIRKEAKKILKSQMFKTIIAAHGEEAMNYLESNRDIKVIFTNFNMPVIDGIELMKLVREEYSKEDIAIIAMLEKNEKPMLSKFLKNGANDFLNKPFTKEEIICRVNNILRVVK